MAIYGRGEIRRSAACEVWLDADTINAKPFPGRKAVMRTLTTVVNPDHTLTIPVPADIPPGPHQVVVVIQEELSLPQSSLAIAN